MPKIRNIIIFVVIAAVFASIYFFFIKPSPEMPGLVSSGSTTNLPSVNPGASSVSPVSAAVPGESPFVAENFLALLLNVKNIKLNDAIFSDPAFGSLHDSSIVLVPDGTEGRTNPFAPFGSDVTSPVAPSPSPLPATAPKATTSTTPAGVAPQGPATN
jgi:hypothetical protein